MPSIDQFNLFFNILFKLLLQVESPIKFSLSFKNKKLSLLNSDISSCSFKILIKKLGIGILLLPA